MQKKSIIAIILIILILITAILFFRGSGQQSNEMKTYNAAGTYNEKATYQNGKITVAGVTIENTTFTGNVLVDEAVGEGAVHFTNCDVKGEVLIKGGGDTIYFDGGSYQRISVEKKGVKIVLLGDAKIETLDAKEACIIVADGNSQIKNMIVEETAGRTSITSQDKGIIENILAKGPADIVLNTPAKTVSFGPDAVGSTLITNAVVDKVQTEAKVDLTFNADVGALLITGSAAGSTVTLGNNATIKAMATDTKVEISGEGSVTSVTTNNEANITGSVIPGVITITPKPVVLDPTGGYMVSTATAKTAKTTILDNTDAFWSSEQNSVDNFNDTMTVEPLSNSVIPAENTPISPLPGEPLSNPVIPAESAPIPPLPLVPALPGTIEVSQILVDPVKADLLMGTTLALKATVLPENATNKNITWESTDTKIATVDNGLVTPVSNGDVTIRARSVNGLTIGSCKITVMTNITAVTMIDTLDAINNNIAKTIAYNADYNLPIIVIAQGFGTETLPCSVNWNPISADTKKVGETTYIGTLTMPGGYVNNDSIKPEIKLTVKPQPVITVTSTMTSQRIYLNGDPGSLKVDATVTEGKTLSYQWSQKTKDSLGHDITANIPGATGSTYDPPVSTTAGTTYYYCDIAAENAVPVAVFPGTVVTGANEAIPTALAELPKIDTQPLGAGNIAPSSPVSLSVTASVLNGGTLTYQWFENKSEVNADGLAIAGANGPKLDTSAKADLGTTYYYVEITNTQAGFSPVTSVSLPVSVTVVP
ncbi:Ig-like domain-containing protein [Acetobacterium sp.]|uniref:Ig-like domain-containing protein n=1 Tax=Acetobacterium sp. TaxID=1872094 RepID=UPI002F417750